MDPARLHRPGLGAVTENLAAFILARLAEYETASTGGVYLHLDGAAPLWLGDAATTQRLVAALRVLVAEVTSWPHVYSPDTAQRCPRSVDPNVDPAYGCGPCECGVDLRRRAVLTALAAAWMPPGPPVGAVWTERVSGPPA